MVVNPVGPVMVWDGGVPRTVTARASTGVTGGQLVYLSGTSNSVSSGLDSYSTADICLGGASSGTLHNGIVTTAGTTASGTNNYVSVALNGDWIVTSAATILAGDAIYANGGDAVTGNAAAMAGSYHPLGRAVTPAGSEGWLVAHFT